MSAQLVHGEDPRDPEAILRKLPERERERFLREYRAAAEAAVHEVAKHKDLQKLLQHWSVLVVSYSKPDFYRRREQVREGRGEYVTLDEINARRRIL